MRKFLIIAMLVLFGMFATTFVVQAQRYVPSYIGNYGVTRIRPCHQRENIRTYEWYYLHLSEQDMETIDLLFLERLTTTNIELLDHEEKIAALKDIKEELIEYIIENNMIGDSRS